MSSNWDPDDSILETAHDRIQDAIGSSVETEIVTSQDEGRRGLGGREMPVGGRQEMLPVALPHRLLAFQTTLEPNTLVPRHSHEKAAVFRVVIQGSVHYGEKELKAGDWMYVPPGKHYELRAGAEPCLIWHMYIGPIPIIVPLPF